MSRADAMELARATAELWHELNPKSVSALGGIRHNMYHSIIGDAEYPYAGYAADMCRWLERNIGSGQYERFKAIQKGLGELGVVPWPRD